MFGPTSNPWDEANNSIDNQAAKIAQLGAGYAAGSLAGRGMTQALGGLGLKPASVERAETLKEALEAARDPMGDMLTTYKNLAEELHRRGLVEEAMKAEQMYESAKTKKLDSDMKRENLQSQIDARKEREKTRAMLATAKLADKPWGAEAMKFYAKHAPKFDSASWKKWFETLESTGGNFTTATTALEAVDGKASFGKMVTDPVSGRVGQWDSRGQFHPKDNKGFTIHNNQRPDYIKDIQDVTTRTLPPEFAEDIKALRIAQQNYMLAATDDGEAGSAAFAALENAWAKMNRTDSQVAQKEMAALKQMGGIGARLAQTGTRWLSGKPTATRLAAYRTLLKAREQALREWAQEKRERANLAFDEMIKQGAPESFVNLGRGNLDPFGKAELWDPPDPMAASAPTPRSVAGQLPNGVSLKQIK